MFFNHKIKIGFDKVYCISYCRNIEKQNNMRKVMKYLGIPFEFIYGADFSNFEILKSQNFHLLGGTFPELKISDFKYYTHFVAASYDHYTAVIHAYESGANSVLIIEDDCAFLNDKKVLEYYLCNYPKDADIVKFGYFNWYELKKKHNIKDNEHKYIKQDLDKFKFNGSQFYGLCNRNIMKQYINEQSRKFVCCDSVDISIPNVKLYGLASPLGVDSFKRDYFKAYNDQYNLLESI
jgi:hypothetical protein